MSTSSRPSRDFVSQILTLLVLFALALLVGAVIWRAVDVLLVIFAGILLGVFLCSLSHTISSYLPLGYAWCLAIVTIVIFGGTATLVVLLVPQIAESIGELGQQLSDSIPKIREQMEQSALGRELHDQARNLGDWTSSEDQQKGMLSAVGTMFQTTFGALANLVVIFFVGLYTAATPDVYRRGIIKLVPPERRERASEVLAVLRETLWRWILGRLFSMSVVGISTGIGLALLGVPLPITMGVIAAVLTFIPNIGPVLSVIPPLLLALPQGAMLAVYVGLLYFVLQLLESYLLTPIIQRYEVSLPPALTISVQLLMSVMAGFWGLTLATPLAATVMVLIKELYICDVLERPATGETR